MITTLPVRLFVIAALLMGASLTAVGETVAPPCDRYPAVQQGRCQTIWKQLNDQAVAEVSQFGLAQQKRRDAGQITPEQHLAENMAFIKQSTAQRLQRLQERMARD